MYLYLWFLLGRRKGGALHDCLATLPPAPNSPSSFGLQTSGPSVGIPYVLGALPKGSKCPNTEYVPRTILTVLIKGAIDTLHVWVLWSLRPRQYGSFGHASQASRTSTRPRWAATVPQLSWLIVGIRVYTHHLPWSLSSVNRPYFGLFEDPLKSVP